MAAALESCATALVPYGSRHRAREAVRSLAAHVVQQLHASSPSSSSSTIEFVGWNGLSGNFSTVASRRRAAATVLPEAAVLLDVGVAKLGAIGRGLDAASILLRVDACLTACP